MVPKGYWTKERCKEEALKYFYRSDFQKKSKSAYQIAYRQKWLQDICSHMEYLQIPNGSWNKESCAQEALKYKNRRSFKYGSSGAFDAAYNNEWLDEICSHMIKLNKWSIEKVIEKALLYNTRIDFSKNEKSAYSYACKNNILDIVCNHMKPIGHRFKRLVYSYEFSDNHIYIGLTCDEDRRHLQHTTISNNKSNKSPVFIHMVETGLIPIKKVLSNGYIDASKALYLQDKYKHEYKIKGWNILGTQKKDRNLGGIKIWTKDKCIIEANKYKTRTEFCKNSNGAYASAWKNGWLDEACIHMTKKK